MPLPGVKTSSVAATPAASAMPVKAVAVMNQPESVNRPIANAMVDSISSAPIARRVRRCAITRSQGPSALRPAPGLRDVGMRGSVMMTPPA